MGEQIDLFEASASAVGYLYQLRKALYFCVEQTGAGPDWSVAIEAGDDIEVHDDAGSVLYQLKHRTPGTRMTDKATDLWKSLRIWATDWIEPADDQDRPTFFLLTTAEAAEGGAAYHLRPPGPGSPRDEVRALELLDQARHDSRNKANEAAYKAWDALSADQRRSLIARVHVLDAAPDIDETTMRLLRLLGLAVGPQHAKVFLERLDGWFFRRVVTQLRNRASGPVTGLEFDQVFSDRRDGFGPDNLPIDDDVAEMDGADVDHGDQVFVRQLHLAGIGDNRVRRAVSDYLRAFTQRSRWANDNLLRPGELGKYERLLVEEWSIRFDAMREELGDETAEEIRVREARAIYKWVEQEARFSIRQECHAPFVTMGSYHILADAQRVGWHPDFQVRLMALLEPVSGR
ncbi:ABC-three component system protein [Actinokineospora inagensis]|uniref:ABC-three component system protein n=1 Tax=Actinokineospora inagensis TaxID=103730 RepID=UPI0003FDC099|nr:ABC-three component system protein [Actinokineospora inagensis]